jgi:hypothetical protein
MPVIPGNRFVPMSTARFHKASSTGGNYAKAGRIVARYFYDAQTPEQCAGLQIAVWEAIEVGSDKPEFDQGKFRVSADDETMYYANMYYGAVQQPTGSPDAQQGGGTSSGNAQQGLGTDSGAAQQPAQSSGSGGGATLLQTGGGQGGGQSQMSPRS